MKSILPQAVFRLARVLDLRSTEDRDNVVPMVRFRVLFVLVMLLHHQRKVVHFNVTEHPSTQWTAQKSWRPFPGIPRLSIC